MQLEELSEIEKLAFNKNNRLKAESLLLAWLEYHYETQRSQDWLQDQTDILDPTKKRDELTKRTIDNFDSDLSDGLVLIATTGAYCPFIINEILSKLYVTPRNEAEVRNSSLN